MNKQNFVVYNPKEKIPIPSPIGCLTACSFIVRHLMHASDSGDNSSSISL